MRVVRSQISPQRMVARLHSSRTNDWGQRPRLTTKWLMNSDSTPNRPGALKEIPLFDSSLPFMKRGSMQFLLDVLEAELKP